MVGCPGRIEEARGPCRGDVFAIHSAPCAVGRVYAAFRLSAQRPVVRYGECLRSLYIFYSALGIGGGFGYILREGYAVVHFVAIVLIHTLFPPY